MKKLTQAFIGLLFLSCTGYLSAYAQSNNSSADIFIKLKNFSSGHLPEKAYLHLDKPYYATGDTIYLKAYVTMGGRADLSKLSGILHLELINPKNQIDQSIRLQLVNGLGWGNITLPDTLAAGKYHIRAYTQWMRNEGNYFEQDIPVGTVHNLKIPESSTARSKMVNAKPDMQFFPEGGNLVAGIRSKIAFKAINNNGLGISLKGTITDNTGKVITEFASAHWGMGSFYIEPEEGKTYKANITYTDGSHNTIDLPVPAAKGIALFINNDSIPNAAVRIQANKAYFAENKGKIHTLLIYSGGMATTVTCKLDSSVINLDIIKRRLHTGVARVTLFSPTQEPLCERLLFIQNHDQLNLDVSSDKTAYTTREKVNIGLNVKTRTGASVAGHFSVSVIDENKVPVDENTESTIMTNLLLTSDLKGTIEQPNYYFTNITNEKLEELDLVMLTHGYRRFEWKQVLSDNYPPLAYQPEKALEISGMAKSLFGKPLSKATVSLISMHGGPFISAVTDEKGQFSFSNLVYIDTTRFILQAVNAKGKNSTQLTYNEFKPAMIPAVTLQADNLNSIIPASYLENNEKQQEELNRLGLGKGRTLKEVKIRDIKRDDKYETQSLAGAGHADQVMHAKDIGSGGFLALNLNGRLHGIGFRAVDRANGGVPYLRVIGTGPMLVIVDGARMMPGFGLNEINISDVETIEVLKFASIYGIDGGNGVLVITTKRGAGTDAADIASIGVLPIKVTGYSIAREFYSPKYESTTTNSRPDLRSTIYWNPELATDKDGNASFNYYNADGHGSYRIVIEGIDENGNIGRQVYRYKVE